MGVLTRLLYRKRERDRENRQGGFQGIHQCSEFFRIKTRRWVIGMGLAELAIAPQWGGRRIGNEVWVIAADLISADKPELRAVL